MKRLLQHELETRIGRALIAGGVVDGASIRVELEDRRIAVHHHHPEAARA